MNSQHETSTASNEQQHQINIETSNNIEIISSDTKDLLIDNTNNSVVLNCVELCWINPRKPTKRSQIAGTINQVLRRLTSTKWIY